LDSQKVNISDNIFVRNDLHTPKRLTPLGKSYTRVVRILKYSFSVIAFLIITTVVIQLSGITEDEQPSQIAKEEESSKTVAGQIEVTGAKYEGVDEKGNPYTITADKANRSTEREDGVLFDNPITDIELDNKTWLALKAAGGFFNRFSENIIMEDGVIAYHDSGYEINMKNIVLNLKDKSGSTASPVSVQGPMGYAEAQNMEVKPGADRIIFGGPVHIKLFDISFLKG